MDRLPSTEDHALFSMGETIERRGVRDAVRDYLARQNGQDSWEIQRAVMTLTLRYSPQAKEDLEDLWTLWTLKGERKGGALFRELMEVALKGNSHALDWATLVAQHRPHEANEGVLHSQWFLGKFPSNERARQKEWQPLWKACWVALSQNKGLYSEGDAFFPIHFAIAHWVKTLVEDTGGEAGQPSVAVAQEWKEVLELRRSASAMLAADPILANMEVMARKVLLEHMSHARGQGLPSPRKI